MLRNSSPSHDSEQNRVKLHSKNEYMYRGFWDTFLTNLRKDISIWKPLFEIPSSVWCPHCWGSSNENKSLDAVDAPETKPPPEVPYKKQRYTRDFLKSSNSNVKNFNAPVKWTLQTNGNPSSLIFHQNKCIVGCNDGSVIFFNINGLASRIVKLPYSIGTLIQDEGFVYAWCPNKYGFHSTKGALYDVTDTAYLMFLVEDIGEAIVLVCMYQGNFIVCDDKGSVFLLDDDGKDIWRKENNEQAKALLADDSGVYVCLKKKICKLNLSQGVKLWEWEAFGRFSNIQDGILHNELLYVEVSGGIVEIDIKSGLSKREFIPGRHRASGICIDNDMLITGSCPTVIFSMKSGEELYRMNFAGRLSDSDMKLHDSCNLIAAWDQIYCIDLTKEGIQRAMEGKSIKTQSFTTDGMRELFPPEQIRIVQKVKAKQVVVKCTLERGRINVFPCTEGYEKAWKVHFPVCLKEDQISYVVDKLVPIPDQYAYRCLGEIKQLEEEEIQYIDKLPTSSHSETVLKI